MSFIAQFQIIEEKDKAAVVRKLLESSTPSFDFFYLIALSVTMASLGLLADSPSIVIGSMLIAPLLYPILGVALGLVMSNFDVLRRSSFTLLKSLVIGLAVSTIATWFFGDGFVTTEIMARINPSLLHFMVALVAGAAVSFALAQPEWSETLPGIAISVALIPPLATIGVGIAMFDGTVIAGATVLLLINMFGIIFAAMVSFSLMNLYEKQNIAVSTIKREDRKLEEEKTAIEEVLDNNGKKAQDKL